MFKQNSQSGTSEGENRSEIDLDQDKQAEELLGTETEGEKPEDEADQKPAQQDAAQNAEHSEHSAEEKIIELEGRLLEAEDKFLRKAADFENFRKRMNREKQEAIEYANQSLLLDLIQIMDDFERALIAAESIANEEFSAFYQGIAMIEKRLSSQLENKWGLKRFNSLGEPFDPNFHEALLMEKSAEVSEAMVQEEYYKGYTLKERVVRSAKVKVLMPETADEVHAQEAVDENA